MSKRRYKGGSKGDSQFHRQGKSDNLSRMKKCICSSILGPQISREKTLQLAKEFQLEGIEWRVGEDYHLSPKLTAAQLNEIRLITEEAGLQMPVLGGYFYTGSPSDMAKALEMAQGLGITRVRCWPARFPADKPYEELLKEARGQLESLQPLLKEAGVQCLLELHPGWLIPSPSSALRLLQGFDPQWFGTIYDPGNMVMEGYENPAMALSILGPYLAHVHVKNALWRREEGKWQFHWASLSEGKMEWAPIYKELKAVGYDGWFSLEDFRDIPAEVRLQEFVSWADALEKGQ